MSSRPPYNSTGSLDHLAMRYLREALDTSHPTDEPYVLNPVERRVIRRTKIVTLIVAALVGVLGVLLFYWPPYSWPSLFANITVLVFGQVYELPLITLLWGFLLVYTEVNLLVALNLWGVKAIMAVCRFPRFHDAQYDRHVRALTQAALDKTKRGLFRFGLDPYLNRAERGLSLFFVLNLAKAALGSLVLKLSLSQFINRYALRPLTDLAGMPFYALWNAWASWQILHEAQIRVMAPMTIREFVQELHEEWGKNDQFRPLILEALQYVAILKRQHNYAHFLLNETLTDRFDLRADVSLTGQFAERAAQAPAEVRRSLERLIVFGVLVDGRLSWFEKQRLRQLRQKGFLTYSADEIRRIGSDYRRGRGLWV